MDKKYGFSIIAPTYRPKNIENIIKNYTRQVINDKELIIIVNNSKVKIESIEKIASEYENISVYQLSEDISLGECLNFGIEKSKYDFIAKFDDDDYYGRFYLEEAYNAFSTKDCQVVSKLDVYYYFEEFKRLMISIKNKENSYYFMGTGSTICFKKDIFKDIKFADVNRGEDAQFFKDCMKNEYKLYITSKFNHLIYRSKDYKSHTYKAHPDQIMRYCKEIQSNISLNKCYRIIDKRQFTNKR